MALASIPKVVLGSIAFAIFWVLAVFPAVPFLPIGRTAGSLLGAMLMVIFRVLSPDQAYAAIDLPILGLLFGTMVVSVYLERADMFKYLEKLLSWKSKGANDLLCRICAISAILSAFFTNDTACVFLTEFVLKVAKQHNLPPHPFLLALASSANIGSSATLIGNPQNLVIAIKSGISFGEFLIGILRAVLMGMVVNTLILLTMYRRVLSIHKDEEDAASKEEVNSLLFSAATMSQLTYSSSQELINFQNSPQVQSQRNQVSTSETPWIPSSTLKSTRNSNALRDEIIDMPSQIKEETTPLKTETPSDTELMHSSEERNNLNAKWKRVLWKSCVYIITLCMLVALLLGLNMSWTAITAALALVVLDFKDASSSLEKVKATSNKIPPIEASVIFILLPNEHCTKFKNEFFCLEQVSHSLLVFFCGMFITVDGFNKTGIPSALWELMEPYSRVDHVTGIAVLALVILVLSNLASNVPTVILLGARVAVSASAISKEDEKKAWLILAWVSTVAGNLSLLGSAANLIVCEQARRAPNLKYTLTFWDHFKFGLPSTLVVTAIGLAFIK